MRIRQVWTLISAETTEAFTERVNVSRLPRLCKERFQRIVQAQDRVPALAGDRLNPVAALDALRLCWREVFWSPNMRGSRLARSEDPKHLHHQGRDASRQN